MKIWAVTENNRPLRCMEVDDPVADGTEVVLEVTRCGVCHSDVHFWHGSYDLGEGRRLSLKDRGVTLPRAPGHEIVARVVAMGPEATGVSLGDERIVYPWIGCGYCPRCLAGQDNLCSAQRSLGVLEHGGMADRVKVPHPRYLVEFDGIDPALAATYACSGLTVYSAIGKILPLAPEEPVLLVGAGGLGLAGIAVLRAFGHREIAVVDTGSAQREAAMEAGATVTFDGRADDLAARIRGRFPGGVHAALDFVNTSATAALALDLVCKGGTLVLVGIAGGTLPISLAGMVFRAQSIFGSNSGSLQELREVVQLARDGRLLATPIRRGAKSDINEVIADLEAGRIVGRVVLS